MSYRRVIPRDLFNEAKLLKCLGRVALLLHDRDNIVIPPNDPDRRIRVEFEHEDPESGFIVAQNPNDGSIHCENLDFLVHVDEARANAAMGHAEVALHTPLNSRQPWPLEFGPMGDDFNDFDDFAVFDDKGDFTAGFLNYVVAVADWLNRRAKGE